MGYPENALTDDEWVVLHRHPHWKRLFPAVLALLGSAALAAFAAGFAHAAMWDPHTKNVIFAVIGATWLVAAGWLTGWPCLSWLTTHFVITDRRVLFRHGAMARSRLDIPLARITAVDFTSGIADRMACTGTLIIESANRGPLAFHDIPQVKRVHALLSHEVFDTVGSESFS